MFLSILKKTNKHKTETFLQETLDDISNLVKKFA